MKGRCPRCGGAGEATGFWQLATGPEGCFCTCTACAHIWEEVYEGGMMDQTGAAVIKASLAYWGECGAGVGSREWKAWRAAVEAYREAHPEDNPTCCADERIDKVDGRLDYALGERVRIWGYASALEVRIARLEHCSK